MAEGGVDELAGAGPGVSTAPAPGPTPLLEVVDVYAGYGGGDVLRGATLAVARGSITCIVGPNGAGKSTLAGVVSGLLRPRQGQVLFEGRQISGGSPRQVLRHGIVQVPQNHSLFRRMTVRENVEFGAFLVRDRRLIRQRYERIAEAFPIVAQRASARAGSLSGGEQRLVEFARCLMLEPTLIVLDEQSLGLAPQMVSTVFRTIRRINQEGCSILLVEQNARAALRLSSHGVVLEAGRVRLSGTGREVLENPDIARLYLGGGRVAAD